MQTWAMIILGLIVAWQLYALYGIYSKSGTIGQYLGWAAWTATALVIIYLAGGFT